MEKLAVWSPRPDARPVEVLSSAVTIYGLPMLAIVPLSLNNTEKQAVDSAQALFYVSQHAVHSLLSQFHSDALMDKMHIAIGEKTAAALINAGLSPTLVARPPYNSEALLADKDFQRLPFSALAIICGQSGRQLLGQTLQQQGKKVSRIVSYRRDKCHVAPQDMVEFTRSHSINALMLTSCEVADAVAEQLQRGGMADYWHCPTFALSRRIADYATDLGFTQVIAAPHADQKTLYKNMMAWHHHNGNKRI